MTWNNPQCLRCQQKRSSKRLSELNLKLEETGQEFWSRPSNLKTIIIPTESSANFLSLGVDQNWAEKSTFSEVCFIPRDPRVLPGWKCQARGYIGRKGFENSYQPWPSPWLHRGVIRLHGGRLSGYQGSPNRSNVKARSWRTNLPVPINCLRSLWGGVLWGVKSCTQSSWGDWILLYINGIFEVQMLPNSRSLLFGVLYPRTKYGCC